MAFVELAKRVYRRSFAFCFKRVDTTRAKYGVPRIHSGINLLAICMPERGLRRDEHV